MESTIYSQSEIQALERRYRATLINILSGFKSANLIGTTDSRGNHNLAIFNSVVHIGAKPPLLGMILRPTSVARHTFENINETGYYTINHIHQEIFQKAHQSSAKYDREISEFEACGFFPEVRDTHCAPYVRECFVKMGLKYVEEHFIEANGTRLIVGEIIELILPEGSVEEDGFLNLAEYGTVTISGLDAYFSTEKIERRAFARPNEVPKTL
ncbi:MAG: flavin reductase [Bacteroidota bacterium]